MEEAHGFLREQVAPAMPYDLKGQGGIIRPNLMRRGERFLYPQQIDKPSGASISAMDAWRGIGGVDAARPEVP